MLIKAFFLLVVLSGCAGLKSSSLGEEAACENLLQLPNSDDCGVDEDHLKPMTFDSNTYLTLDQLLDIALTNHPATQKAWWNARRAAAALGIAESDLFPYVDAFGKVRHAREVKYPNGPNTHFTMYSAELSLFYLLMDFGRRDANIATACWALVSADWKHEWTIQKVLFETTAAYYEVVHACELLKARKSSLKDATVALKLAEHLYKAGIKSQTDLFGSQAAAAKIKMDIVQQRAQLAIAKGRLCAALGLSADVPIKVALPPEEPPFQLMDKDLATLLAEADQLRADLLAKRAEVHEKNSEWIRSLRSGKASVHVLGETGWRQYLQKEHNGYNYSVSLVLDIPIFHGFEYTYQRRLAYANFAASEEDLRQLEIEIALEVLTYSQRLKASQELLTLSHDYLSFALKTYDGALDSYKAGTQSVFDVLEAEEELSEARVRYYNARVQLYVSLAHLAYATGTLGGCL